MSDPADATVTIEVDGTPVHCRSGRPLLAELLSAGRVVATACGGQGSCHLCRVEVLSGELPSPTRVETRALGNVLLAKGIRLACQIPTIDALRVRLPETTRPLKSKGSP